MEPFDDLLKRYEVTCGSLCPGALLATPHVPAGLSE
jgi:hypothetical protein